MKKNENTRVLHFLSSLSVTSGVASVVMNYYRNINRKNVQFDFVYFEESNINYIEEINLLGGRVYKLDKPKISISTIKKINNFFKSVQGKYDILHNHELYLNFILYYIAKKNKISKVITHSHTTAYSDRKISAIRNKILCLPINIQTDCMMACSEAAGIAVYSKRNKDKIFVLNNAINIEKFLFDPKIRDKIRKNINVEGKYVIGNVGRFNKQKNHSFMIDIFNEIRKDIDNAKLLLVGDGPLYNEVKNKVMSLGIEDDVIFLGRRNDVNELLQGMDIFILPSLYEGLPVIGVEAQISGLHCIMSETITKEVSIRDVEYLGIQNNFKLWAKKINDESKKDKSRTINDIKMIGNFDIKLESKKLENIYCKQS